MLASFLKMVDVQTRRNVGILWAKVANKNPDDDYIALDTSPVLREYTWAKVLQQAYLSAVSKAYDESRRTLTTVERGYGKREYLKHITTPMNLSELSGELSGVRESMSSIVQTVKGIALRERMLEAFQPLKTYIRREVERLYREGYESTLQHLNGRNGPHAETTDMARWQTLNIRGRWVTTKDDNRVFISESGKVMPKSEDGGSQVYETEKSAPDRPSTPHKAETTGRPRLTHDEVRDHVADTRNKWGYKQPMQVKEDLGPEFTRGDIKWREFGNCRLDTGEIVIYSKSPWLNDRDVKRLTAHEMMHGMYERVYQQYERERKEINEKSLSIPNWRDAPIRASGELKPDFHKQYPTYARLWKFIDDYTKLTEEDGITPYSKAYWDDNKAGKVKHHIAVHETLAELAGLEEMPDQIKIKTSLHYERFFKSVKDEYKVITGQGNRKRVHKDDVVMNAEEQFSDHTMYFDEEWEPTTPEKAVYIRWWKADGSNGVARKMEEETTANVYCPTGEGGGIDPTCKADEARGGTAVLDNPDQPASTIDKPKGGNVQRTNTLDQVSQRVFGDKLAGRSPHSTSRQLTDDDIRAIGFSPEGTTVVAHGSRGGEIHVNTESDEKDERGSPQLMASRTIRKPWFGPLTCYNGTVKVWGSFKGKGLELFDKQVKTLQGLGVKRILASASGDAQAAKTDPKTGLGYYVWPRMGYSGIMKSSQIAKLPEEIRKALKGKRDIRDLFDLPGGPEAWKEHGSTIKVHFDLSPNSRNMRALEAYKEERAKRPIANADENCGTGKGGFQPGNTCAAGEGKQVDKEMFRGVGEGADSHSGFEWYSTTEGLADRYAYFRKGNIKKERVQVKNPVEIVNPNAFVSANSFFAGIMSQVNMKTIDRGKAMAARKSFLAHFGDESREIIDYWSNPEAKNKTRELLEALGFDSVRMQEGGEETIAVLRKK